MAERLTAVDMQAFRGVAESYALVLPNGRSCVVLGDNGTGKSTIADAIEWYFRGSVEFLTKEGRTDAIRHTGARAELSTRVSITTDGQLSGSITSSHPSAQATREIGRSEHFLLRGRALAEFVDKTKSEKWRALAELLGLDAIDHMRLDLQRVANELESTADGARAALDQKRLALSKRVADVSDAGVLAGHCGTMPRRRSVTSGHAHASAGAAVAGCDRA